VNPTACSRCVAERRAQRARVVMNVAAAAAIAAGVVPCLLCCVMSGAMDAPSAFTVREASGAEGGGAVGAVLALALASGAVVLTVVVDHLTRRASTPLPPPSADPLATYRDGPPAAECPRHPFAR
jgi:hypothetical protein